MYDPMYQPTPDSAHYAQFMRMRTEYEKRVSEYENESLETAEEEEQQTSERPAVVAPTASNIDDDEDDSLDSFMLGIQVLTFGINIADIHSDFGLWYFPSVNSSLNANILGGN